MLVPLARSDSLQSFVFTKIVESGLRRSYLDISLVLKWFNDEIENKGERSTDFTGALDKIELAILDFLDVGFCSIWQKRSTDEKSYRESGIGYLVLEPSDIVLRDASNLLKGFLHHFQVLYVGLNNTFTYCSKDETKGVEEYDFNLKDQWSEFAQLAARLEDELVGFAPKPTSDIFQITQGMTALRLQDEGRVG
jgi:hypothetical protein